MSDREELQNIVETQNVVIIVLIALFLTLLCANIGFLTFNLCLPPAGYTPVVTPRRRHRHRAHMIEMPSVREGYDEI